MKKCFFWGASGQAKVLNEFIEKQGYKLMWLFDNNKKLEFEIDGVSIVGDWNTFTRWAKKNQGETIGFCVAVGGLGKGKERIDLQKKIAKYGFRPLTLIHPNAYVAKKVRIGEGSQLLSFSFVGVGSEIGDSVIVNTKASVDHDCAIKEGVHIMPGAVLTGCITVERYATIGSGAIILPHLTIGEGAIVGAGAVVTKNVAPHTTVAGNPAHILKK